MGSTFSPLEFSPEENLGRYLRAVRAMPMLTLDEEQALARRSRDGDEAATNDLVVSHMRLVAKIALHHRGYGLPIADMISEGTVGLIQAVRRFDPDKGFRLSTYAMWWIRAAVQEYILHSWSLVKIGTTAAQKKLFFNLRRMKAKMRAFDEGDLAPEMVERIATELSVSEDEVVHMNRRMRAPDQSLNTPVGEDRSEERQDWLADDTESQEDRLVHRQSYDNRRAMLARALGTLGPRERHILINRQLRDRPATLEALSIHHGISRERVRQIESRSHDKLRRSVRNAAIEQVLRA